MQQQVQYDEDSYIQNQHSKFKRIACRCLWCFCGFLLIILSLQVAFVPHLIRKTVHDGIHDALVITSNTSSGFDSWQTDTKSDSVVPWMEARFFNVTNKYDVIHNGALPQLQITPPMIYNEMTVKFNISFTKDKEWAQYNTWEYYTHDAKRSHLKPTDQITIISPLIGALYYEQKWHTGLSEKLLAIKELEKNLKYINISDILFWSGTAEDLLFNIYHPHIPIHILDENNYKTIWINESIPFGLLGNGSNSSNASYEIINTGNTDNTRIGELKYYGKFGEYVDCWDPQYSLAPGHDTYFGINAIKKHDIQAAFVSTLARNIFINWNYSYTWKGIELYRYTVQVSPQFDTNKQYPPNQQFFQFNFSGIENLTNCSGGLPLFVSMPYFLGGDKYLIDNSVKMGLPYPDWNTDLPYIDLEPITGAILRANKSLQINTMIHSLPWVKGNTSYSAAYRNLPNNIVIPMVELSECEQFTDSQASSFKSQIVDTQFYANVLEITGYIACGLLVVFCLSSTFVYGKRYASKHQFDNIDKKYLFNDFQQNQ
eukprot:56073_1